MGNELFVVSPKTLGTQPSYYLQRHTISRSIHGLSATALKLAAMATSLLPFDFSVRKVTFTFSDFIGSLGLEKGGNSYSIFVAAVNECMGAFISIEGPDGWEKYTWFTKSSFDKRSGKIMMEFSDALAEHLTEMKKFYSKISLENLGKLSSRYAVRIYELAMSYASMAGKNGNQENCWYFEREIEEIRTAFVVEKEKYKLMADFRRNVIEGPVKEINKANIGIEITPEYIRMGKFLHSVRFNCKKIPKKTERLQLKGENPESLEKKEFERLKKMYPDEYNEYFQEEMSTRPVFDPGEDMRQMMANYKACLKLKEVHGIRR